MHSDLGINISDEGVQLCQSDSVFSLTCLLPYLLLSSPLPSGLQRVHNPRDEPPSGAEPHAPRVAQGDRAHGQHHPPQIQLHPDAAEAEHVRSRHDPALPLPRCQVSRAPVTSWPRDKRPAPLIEPGMCGNGSVELFKAEGEITSPGKSHPLKAVLKGQDIFFPGLLTTC